MYPATAHTPTASDPDRLSNVIDHERVPPLPLAIVRARQQVRRLQVAEPARLLLRHGHRDRVPGEVSHGTTEVLQEQGSQIPARPQTDQNALHGNVGS